MKKEETLAATPKLPGLNVVGKIDLDGCCEPKLDTSMSREDVRKHIDEWQPKKWQEITERTNNSIQRYNDGDVLEFKLKGGSTGVAIGLVDPIKRKCGYYIAMGLYGDDVITKAGTSVMEDGAIAGEWSDRVKFVILAKGAVALMAKNLLMPKINDDREKFHELLVDEYMKLIEKQKRLEQEEQRKERERILAEQMERERSEESRREKEEAIRRIQQERQRLIDEMTCCTEQRPRFIEYDAVLCEGETLDDLHHLPYMRGEKTPEIGEWPRITTNREARSYFYNIMGRTNLTFEKIALTRTNGSPVRNYLLSHDFMHEMNARHDEFETKYHSFVDAIEKVGESGAGSVSWINHSGIRQTVIWYVHYTNALHWNLIYLEDDDIIMHQLFTKRLGVGNDFSQVMWGGESTAYASNKMVLERVLSKLLRFFGAIRNFTPQKCSEGDSDIIFCTL